MNRVIVNKRSASFSSGVFNRKMIFLWHADRGGDRTMRFVYSSAKKLDDSVRLYNGVAAKKNLLI